MTRIALISDMHITQKYKSVRLLKQAFESICKMNTDFVIGAGDNVNGCQKDEFASVQRLAQELTFYPALGNHDYFENHPYDIPDEKAREAFLQQMLQENNTVSFFRNGAYALWHGDIPVIFLDCVQNRRNFKLDDEQLEWLKEQLDKTEDCRFRIVVNHMPLVHHTLGRGGKQPSAFFSGDGKLQKLIDSRRRIIYVSGHTHNRIDSDFPSAEQDAYGNIYLNAGSIGNTMPCPREMKKLKPLRNMYEKGSAEYKALDRYFKAGSMGLFLDVQESTVTVNGYDFKQNEFIERCHFDFDI